MIYIYYLKAPNGDVRYVGLTKDLHKRLQSHIQRAKQNKVKSHKNSWINSLLQNNQSPSIVELDSYPDQELAAEAERLWIAFFKNLGHNLTNLTAGGDGLLNPSDETRQKMRNAQLGKKLPNEQKAKIRASCANKRNSPEAIEKMRIKATGRKHTEATKQKLSNTQKTIGRSPAQLQQLANVHKSLKGKPRPLEVVEKMKEAWRLKKIACTQMNLEKNTTAKRTKSGTFSARERTKSNRSTKHTEG